MKKVIFAIVMLVLLIGCDNGYDLGNGYALATTVYGSRGIVNHITPQTADYAVFGHVFEYIYDENFILALQIPEDSLLDLPHPTKSNWNEMDRLCKNRNDKCYYIIDKKKDSTYGPVDKKQYFIVRSNLHVPNSLRLKKDS